MSLKETKEFHFTTSKELLAIKDRVRNLVDHWSEDGSYKEAILKTVISRFLPKKYSISTGFVVRQTSNREKHEPSKQIDLIIYDNSFPTFFKEGDFAIVTPDSVKGIIEVKANLKKQKSKKVIEKANSVGKFIFEGKKNIEATRKKIKPEVYSKENENRRIPFFNGIFSFEGYEKTNFENLKQYIKRENDSSKNDQDFKYFCVNHISFNKDTFYKYWGKHWSIKKDNYEANIYELNNLSFSFFISNLIDYLSDSTTFNTNLWFPQDKSLSDKQIGFNFTEK